MPRVAERPDSLHAALSRALARARGEVPVVSERVRFEMRRKLLHVVVAILAVPLLLLLPFWAVLGLAVTGIVVTVLTWAIERRRLPPELKGPFHEPLAEVLNKTRRPGEDFPWSPVLYTVSLILIGLAHLQLGLSWSIAFAAYAILGLGDAASALVGVAYGRTKLPWNRKKSVEGTFAGLTVGFFAGAVMGVVPFAFAAGAVALTPLFFLIVLAGAVAGALAETIPRVEDNFVVPLSAAAAMFLLAGALGVPLP